MDGDLDRLLVLVHAFHARRFVDSASVDACHRHDQLVVALSHAFHRGISAGRGVVHGEDEGQSRHERDRGRRVGQAEQRGAAAERHERASGGAQDSSHILAFAVSKIRFAFAGASATPENMMVTKSSPVLIIKASAHGCGLIADAVIGTGESRLRLSHRADGGHRQLGVAQVH